MKLQRNFDGKNSSIILSMIISEPNRKSFPHLRISAGDFFNFPQITADFYTDLHRFFKSQSIIILQSGLKSGK